MNYSGSYYVSISSVMLVLLARACYGSFKLGFDIHHRFSDPVKAILPGDDLPEKSSLGYHSMMVHRDRLLQRRHLRSDDNPTLLTFLNGNTTYRIDSLGFLYYANVSVGTPSSSFIVALDTGSDLFWLPCECLSCVTSLVTSFGQKIPLNMYGLSMSSTSQRVSCGSHLCSYQDNCHSASSSCAYLVPYLSNGTSSSGILVEDEMHFTTDDPSADPVDAKLTFGCGQHQTGSFLNGAAPNGLFGLGTANISVPSTLAREGYTSNSFSMCFGLDGVGRISFGDKGSSDQNVTPFNPSLTYNISIVEVHLGGDALDTTFTAIFDSGTTFTYLSDPTYSFITTTFDKRVQQFRFPASSDIPFEYCYTTSSTIPTVGLSMNGGHHFNVADPLVVIPHLHGTLYCLGIIQSGNVNIIGQNFMTGYQIVFDREENKLGWRRANCSEVTNTLAINKSASSSFIPPAAAVISNPEATAAKNNISNTSLANYPLNPCFHCFLAVLVIFFSFFSVAKK